jgi:hypothetical protein
VCRRFLRSTRKAAASRSRDRTLAPRRPGRAQDRSGLTLERDGWYVRHDVLAERGNRDHVVVGPGGAYLLATGFQFAAATFPTVRHSAVVAKRSYGTGRLFRGRRPRRACELVRLVVGRQHPREAQGRPHAHGRKRRRPHTRPGRARAPSPPMPRPSSPGASAGRSAEAGEAYIVHLHDVVELPDRSLARGRARPDLPRAAPHVRNPHGRRRRAAARDPGGDAEHSRHA